MIICKESGGTLQRTVLVTLRPTVTEVADVIWNLDSDEQITLLGCLKRRFCNDEAGLLQLASVANALDKTPQKKSDAKIFVKYLADYVLGSDHVLKE